MAFYEMLPGAGMPSGLQAGMDSVLNKKFGTSTTYPAEGWPDTVNLMGPLPEKTVSGAIVTFSDGADAVPLKKCEITLPASLDGYLSVDVVQSGKNLLNGEDAVKTANNIRFYYPSGKYYLAGTYTLSISESVSGLYVRNISTSTNIATKYNSNFITFTLTEKTLIEFNFYKVGINQDDNVMLEVGSTASAYEPYVAPTTHTATLGRTIYGGEVDIVNGEGQEKYKIFTASDVTSLYWNGKKAQQVDTNHRATFRIALPSGYITVNNSLCNELSYTINIASGSGEYEGYQLIATAGIYFCIDLADIGMENATSDTPDEDFINAIHNYGDNLKFVVELATPKTFTFDPVPIDSKLGNNTIWSEQGDTEVTYRADIALALGE